MDDQLLIRQAIFNTLFNVDAYELLFQNAPSITHLTQEKLARLVGNNLAFVDCTLFFRQPEFDLSTLREQLIIEISANAISDPESYEAIKTLRQQGYRFALIRCKDTRNLTYALDLFDFIKLDVLSLEEETLVTQTEFLKPRHSNLIAEKIENHELLKLSTDLGFNYFQGNFLSYPNLNAEKKEGANGLILMRLLNTLQNPDIGPTDVEEALSQEPRLAYKLLQVINSPAYGIARRLESLREAIIYMGLNPLKRWASLIALSNVEGKPQELTTSAMVRAKMCEILSEKYNLSEGQKFFTVGLLSTVDALMDTSMAELLESLSLSEELNTALLEYEGKLGQILRRVVAYERGAWEEFDLSENDYKNYVEAYIASVEWAEAYCSQLQSAGQKKQ